MSGCLDCTCNKYPKITGTQLSVRVNNVTPQFSGLMVIGESPIPSECYSGNVMSGAGAQVLKKTLEEVGMPFKDNEVYYTTAVKCAVPKKKGQKFPSDAPLNCREYLLGEVAAIKPQMILVCGATALQALTGDTKLKVTELYGRVMECGGALQGIKILPIMNPGVLIHKPGDYKPFLSYLQLASTIFNGGKERDTGETIYKICDTEEKCRVLWKVMNSQFESRLWDTVSYDIETTGLDYRVVEFLVLGICFEKNLVYVIPREMRRFVHNFLSGVPWKCLWQHGKYDKKVMWRRGLSNISIDEDTIYQHYVLDETSSHDLGYLTKVYLNAKAYKFKMNQEWNHVELDTYPQYFEALCERVAVDADYTLQLHKVFNEMLDRPENESIKRVYKNLLIPAANYLARIEQNGMLVNAKHLDLMDVKYVALLAEIVAEIERLATGLWDPGLYQAQSGAKSASAKFKPGSSKQMSWMVFDRLKLKPRIKKGKSTAKEILDSIEDAPPLIRKVREYRTVQKEHATYVLGILNARDEDGRVRTNFTLHVTATGRLSSKEPNVQNQPSANGIGNVRKAFIPRPGFVYAEMDYSGAELRWLAFMSRDAKLMEIFQTGRNLHKEVAIALFGPNFTDQDKMLAKAVNFGIAYGREAPSIAQTFNIPISEAQEIIDNWLTTYSGARDYLQWCADQVELGNYLETPWGRRRRFGLVNPASLHNLQNEAKNFPIQSSSSDTLLYTGIQVENDLLNNYNTMAVNLIHDSVLLEIPADPKIIKAVGTLLNAAMVKTPIDLFNCPVPFKTDFEIGVNWGDLGGCEFDYNNPDPLGNNVMQLELRHSDGSKYNVETDFYSWYKGAMAKEDRYDLSSLPASIPTNKISVNYVRR